MERWQQELIEGVKNQMAASGHTQVEAAAKIGVAHSQFNGWLHGRQTPSRQSERRLRQYVEGETIEN